MGGDSRARSESLTSFASTRSRLSNDFLDPLAVPDQHGI